MAKRVSELVATLERNLVDSRKYVEILRDRLALAAEKNKELELLAFELEMKLDEAARRIFDVENDL